MRVEGFANPLGLLVLPVIFLLHLLPERRRRHLDSHLGLWSSLEVEVRGAGPRRVSFPLLLLLDLLIALLLTLALARPQLAWQAPLAGPGHTILLLDIFTSMQTRDVLPDRFTRDRAEATTPPTGVGLRDRATVVAFAREPVWVGDTRQDGLQAVLAGIAGLKAGASGHGGLAEEAAAFAVNYPREWQPVSAESLPTLERWVARAGGSERAPTALSPKTRDRRWTGCCYWPSCTGRRK